MNARADASSAVRIAILDATEALILEEGYAAVSNRVVAARAGVKPTVVQYHFPRMDDLLTAVYRRAEERMVEREVEAMGSGSPLDALWTLTSDPRRTALAQEFMALANHRKFLRGEIAVRAAQARSRHADALAPRVARGDDPEQERRRAVGLAFLISAIARALVTEEEVGLTCGHEEARAIVEDWLRQMEPKAAVRPEREASTMG